MDGGRYIFGMGFIIRKARGDDDDDELQTKLAEQDYPLSGQSA